MEVIPLCPGGENGKHAAFKLQSLWLRVRIPPGVQKIIFIIFRKHFFYQMSVLMFAM